MNKILNCIADVGLEKKSQKSHWPARLDVVQSVSGLLLGLFMWGHMAFVSSILISEDTMWRVTKMFEGQWFFGQSSPGIVLAIVLLVLFMFVVHGVLAMRKLPGYYQQYRDFMDLCKTLHHEDTTLWWVQAVTGLVLAFVAFAHLFQMLTHPGDIGPYESADRVWTGRWWPLYVVLLFAVEIHGGIGLYRLALKWGWFKGTDLNRTRMLLKRARTVIILFFITLGLLTLAAEMKVGYAHRERAGQRYVPADSNREH